MEPLRFPSRWRHGKATESGHWTRRDQYVADRRRVRGKPKISTSFRGVYLFVVVWIFGEGCCLCVYVEKLGFLEVFVWFFGCKCNFDWWDMLYVKFFVFVHLFIDIVKFCYFILNMDVNFIIIFNKSSNIFTQISFFLYV